MSGGNFSFTISEPDKYRFFRFLEDALEIGECELVAPTRCESRISDARQIACYLTVCGLNLSAAEAGRIFGRDATTIRYAIQKVEDQRSAADFDRRLLAIEDRLTRLGILRFRRTYSLSGRKFAARSMQ